MLAPLAKGETGPSRRDDCVLLLPFPVPRPA